MPRCAHECKQGGRFDFDQAPEPPFDQARLVLLQNEIPLERTISAIESSSKAEVIVVFNPSPLPTAEERSSIPWDQIDWLLVNEEEAKELGSDITSRPKGIVRTLGKRGAEVRTRERSDTLRRPAGEVGPAGVVDTTGAGDCFTVRLLIVSSRSQAK